MLSAKVQNAAHTKTHPQAAEMRLQYDQPYWCTFAMSIPEYVDKDMSSQSLL